MKGLRARGDFIVDIKWKKGKLVSAAIHSLNGTPCRLRYGKMVCDASLKQGLTFHWDGQPQHR